MSLLINHFYRFGEFTLDTGQKVLLREGKPLHLTPKVFDTLLILIEHNGRIVEKEELMNRLWPDTFVEEANLTFNIQQLRKAFGDHAHQPVYIETIKRRGYRFIADVEEVLSETSLGQATPRLETFDLQSPEAANGLNRQREAQRLESVIELAENQPAQPKQNFDARPAAEAASTSLGQRSMALSAALIIVLASAGFIFWKFSNGAHNSSGGDGRVDGKSPLASPLKLEKLTVTGQSRHVALSADGKYLAYTRNFEKKSSIWLRQFAANTNVEIVPAAGPIGGLDFAKNGESIY